MRRLEMKRRPLELFDGIEVIDFNGEAHPVPITESDILIDCDLDKMDETTLPRMMLHKTPKSLALYAWTLQQDAMNQIIEQVVLKFGHDGINEDTNLKLASITNNKKVGVIEFQFSLESL
jgi:hypothetical protein